jgi:FtsP/CotA-like multicopper oxidase with cupredoxin domain
MELMILDRRSFLGYAAAAPAVGMLPRLARAAGDSSASKADHTIRIAPLSLELAPGRTIRTTGYNGQVPGPVLRLREGQPVTINVVNDAGYPDLVHWHGLYIPADQDGATEEGSPIIPVGQSLTYAFTPKPSGTRWYHSHAMAMTDLSRSTYSGELVSSSSSLRPEIPDATTGRCCSRPAAGKACG